MIFTNLSSHFIKFFFVLSFFVLLLFKSIKSFAQPVAYNFIGAGTWDLLSNWDINGIPPNPLPAESGIYIEGTGPAILNIDQIFNDGSNLYVRPGTTLIIDSTKNVTMYGSEVIAGILINNGIMNYEQNSNFRNEGKLINFGVVNTNYCYFINNGIINNYGTLTNNSAIYNSYPDDITNNNNAILNNYGIINNNYNSAINSSGTIINDSIINNNSGGLLFIGSKFTVSTLTNSSRGIINNLGSLVDGVQSNGYDGKVINYGLINNWHLDYLQGGALLIDGTFENNAIITNEGLIWIHNTSATFINNSVFNNNNILINEKTITNNGIFNNTIGTYSGVGIFNGSLFTNMSKVIPGNYLIKPGTSGCLYFGNGYTNVDSLLMKINNSTPCDSFDQLNVTGTFTAGGTLSITFGLTPSPGQSFQMINADSYVGNFSNIIVSPAHKVSYANGIITVISLQSDTCIYYRDSDNDGFGDLNFKVYGCAPLAGFVNDSSDCNDSNASIHPGILENSCNGIDNDCDGLIDEDAPIDTYYKDADGDTYGDLLITKDSCTQPIGYVLNHIDCNDANSSIHPGSADNSCDGIDQDCDGLIDEDATVTRYYRDADGDTYGNQAISKDSCAQPIGYVLNHTDCKDNNPSIHPNAADNTCDGIDQDCDGISDEDTGILLTPTFTIIQPTCALPTGTITISNKANLDSASFNNGATYQLSNVKSGLTPGNYIILIKTTTGCISNAANAAINAAPGPASPTLSLTQPTCQVPTGSITISNKAALDSVSFNAGVSYQISNVKSGLASGNYVVNIKTTGGCISNSANAILIPASLTVTILNLDTVYYKSDPMITLNGSPAGGEFRIDGIVTNIFSPLLLNTGSHTVSYKVTQAFCTTTITRQVKINYALVPSDPNQCYTIENYFPFINPLFPIKVAGTSLNNIVQQNNTGALTQKWTFEKISGFYRIKNKASSSYMRVNGANIMQSPFVSPAAEWILEQNNLLGGAFNLKHRTGNYLTTNSSGTYQLAALTIGLTLNQNFKLKFVDCISTEALSSNISSSLELHIDPVRSELKHTSIDFYPNPGKGIFTVRLNDIDCSSEPHLSIYSAIGAKVWERKVSTSEPLRIDLRNRDLPDGLYILLMKNSEMILEKKFIITK